MASRRGGTKKVKRVETGRTIRVGRQGRVVLPVELREEMGVKEGDRLEVLGGEKGTVTLRVVPGMDFRSKLDALQTEARRLMGDRDLVAELLEERRREAERDGW